MIPVHLMLSMPGFEPLVVTIERYAAPTGIDLRGRPVTAAPTEIEVRVVYHQATRKQLERAGLDMTSDWRSFYAATEMRTGAEDGTRPDVIVADGERWEVANVANYARLGGMWIALARRLT